MVATFETETFWYFVLFCQGLSWPHAGRRQKAKNKLVTMDTIQTNRTFTYFCYRTKNRVTVCCNCRCCVVGIANKEEEKRKRSFKFYTAKLSRFSADTPRFFFSLSLSTTIEIGKGKIVRAHTPGVVLLFH